MRQESIAFERRTSVSAQIQLMASTAPAGKVCRFPAFGLSGGEHTVPNAPLRNFDPLELGRVQLQLIAARRRAVLLKDVREDVYFDFVADDSRAAVLRHRVADLDVHTAEAVVLPLRPESVALKGRSAL